MTCPHHDQAATFWQVKAAYMRYFSHILRRLRESIRRIDKTDSKKPFNPEQLENEACPNHLHSSRAVSVHAYILWVRHLSRRRLMACQYIIASP
jgi:hypothetical protein